MPHATYSAAPSARRLRTSTASAREARGRTKELILDRAPSSKSIASNWPRGPASQKQAGRKSFLTRVFFQNPLPKKSIYRYINKYYTYIFIYRKKYAKICKKLFHANVTSRHPTSLASNPAPAALPPPSPTPPLRLLSSAAAHGARPPAAAGSGAGVPRVRKRPLQASGSGSRGDSGGSPDILGRCHTAKRTGLAQKATLRKGIKSKIVHFHA